jgi:uncharacterized membrane protein YedE/YeeE
MTINWIEFTPFASLFGGVAIGLAALAMWLLLGRIMGVSGILGQLVAGEGTGQNGWRLAFIIGVVAAPAGYVLMVGEFTSRMVASPAGLAIAGLLVGAGTAIGSGCTSGHGICGLSRFSIRSFVATCCFVLSGMVTVFILKAGGLS